MNVYVGEGEIKFDGTKEKLSQLTNSKRSLAVEVNAVMQTGIHFHVNLLK